MWNIIFKDVCTVHSKSKSSLGPSLNLPLHDGDIEKSILDEAENPHAHQPNTKAQIPGNYCTMLSH